MKRGWKNSKYSLFKCLKLSFLGQVLAVGQGSGGMTPMAPPPRSATGISEHFYDCVSHSSFFETNLANLNFDIFKGLLILTVSGKLDIFGRKIRQIRQISQLSLSFKETQLTLGKSSRWTFCIKIFSSQSISCVYLKRNFLPLFSWQKKHENGQVAQKHAGYNDICYKIWWFPFQDQVGN